MKHPELILKEVANYQSLLNLLDKNSNLNNYGGFKKALTKLSENQSEMARLALFLEKDLSKVKGSYEHQLINLRLQLQHLSGILGLVEGKKTKNKHNFPGLTYKKIENLNDKDLIKFSQKTIAYAKKLGGYSVENLGASSSDLSRKLEQSLKLTNDFGLNPERVKKLEDSCLAFMKALLDFKELEKEQSKVIKHLTKKLEHNGKIYKNSIEKFISVFEKTDSKFLRDFKELRPGKEKKKEELKMQVA